ncbi:sensor histidine kinase [soil metagenome]
MNVLGLADFGRTAAALIRGRVAPPRQSAGTHLIWPLALVCGFLVFVACSSVYLVQLSHTTDELVNRALRVETRTWIMLHTVRAAESGQRGYLLTGDSDYLDVYSLTTSAIGPAVVELDKLIIDPAQRQIVADIKPLIARKFAELAETIRLYESGQREEALDLVRKGAGRALMTEIRRRSLRFLEVEQTIVDARSSRAKSTIFWLLNVNVLGIVLVISFSGASIFLVRRLTEQERAYLGDLERSNQELDDFAYIASHDLKEPLRGLFNHATFLREDYSDQIDADGVRRLNRLGTLCQRMEQLINDLMYFSRLGRADLAVQPTDPNALIDEIRQMMETLISEHGARIVVPTPMPQIDCDKVRVTEVFRNLITNAVKYNDKAERLVEIGFLESVDTAAGPAKNVFYVRDNGVGIDPEFHQQIFRIFKRLQNAPEGQDNGTGVGLTFVKKIIERHGGRIWLDSRPGEGTVFYFNLHG